MKKIYQLFFIAFFISTSVSAQVLWENFEDTRKGTYGFINGSFIPYFENPDQTGANTSQIAAQYTRNGAELFDVLILDEAMADLTDYVSGAKQMSIDVWSPAAGKVVQITLENDVLAEPTNFPTGRHSVYLATTTVASGWETLTFTFDNQPDASVANDNVNRMVLLFDPNTNNADVYYWDNFNGPEFASDPCDGVASDPQIFNDFECSQNTNFTFSHAGVNFRRILNPDASGANTSEYVAQYNRNGGEENDVIVGNFDGNLSFTNEGRIKLDVWDPGAPTVVIVSLQNAAGDVILEMSATTSVSSTWETLTYDPSSVFAATDISKFVILFDPGFFTGEQYFFDNFQYGAPVSVENLADVVSFVASPNPTQGETTFQYELQSAADVNLSIYDATGKMITQILDENQPSGHHQATWLATDVSDGIYFYTMRIDGKVASGKIILNK
ncbi:MAG: T9SS type A sorting domain-containing protein [Saprospiraceae bacterium]